MGSIPNPLEFKILRASEDDFVTLASVESIANFHMIKTDPKDSIARIIFGPRPPSQENWKLRAKGLVEEAKKGSVLRMYKAVVEEADGKQKIIGCAFWFFYTDPEALEIEDYEDIEWPAPTKRSSRQ
ncbi:hypothetical protein N7470_009003 [Penicillium chermesinum]|nr:hypothetical protein N7470_009003 [Penicillium chermesinum]